jgi:hypothetical protein
MAGARLAAAPFGGGSEEAHPIRGCEEARRLEVDELRPPSAAVAASICGRRGGALVLAAASSVAVLLGRR